MIAFLFFLFSGIAVTAAALMIVHRNPIYSALFLILTLFAVAGHFVLLNAPFIAAVHVIIYAGAVMVLFVFVIMLVRPNETRAFGLPSRWSQVIGLGLATILLVEIGLMLWATSATSDTKAAVSAVGDTASVGKLLFTKYIFHFEVASVLLLAAIVGAVILAKPKVK